LKSGKYVVNRIMRFIKLNTEEEATIKEGYKNHPKFHVRQRFLALLLSNEGMPIPEIKRIIKKRSRTIYSWMNRWEAKGLAGLMILPGRGLKPKLSIENKQMVDLIKKSKNIRP